MATALHRLAEEDPTFQVRSDIETGQTVISGMGELHLEILVDRMLREFKVQANIGRPRVAYRETITRAVDNIDFRYVKQSGGRGQYGHVELEMEPGEPGSGVIFEIKDRWRLGPKRVHPCSTKRRARSCRRWGGRWLPGSRYESLPGRRLFPRGGLERNGLQNGSVDGFQRRYASRKTHIVGTGDESGSGCSRGIPRGCGWSDQQPAWRCCRDGDATRECPSNPGNGAALQKCSVMQPNLRSATQGRGAFTMEFDHYSRVQRKRSRLNNKLF